MTAHKHRHENEAAFVLHSYPYRETSLLLEAFSREHGRVALVARGARRPHSPQRGVLMAFQPLALSWFGKHELRTLHGAEWQGGQPQLRGTALLCGFYVNELLLNLLARDDPHPQLFEHYRLALQRLAHEPDFAATLRRFEKNMLQELGYALLLEREADSGRPIDAGAEYRYVADKGALKDAEVGLPVAGKTLHDMTADDYRDPQTAQQSKQLMRMLLNHHLAGKPLYTRELIKDLPRT